jgi:uncharacterized protein YbjT (DUF2867 family)
MVERDAGTPRPLGRRVLVTGASGNVGREVVAACLARGFAVRAGHPRTRDAARSSANLERVSLDFQDRATWGPALLGVDLVFLLRPPPLGDMRTTLIPFIDEAYRAGVRHILFLSVLGAERMKWVPHRAVELHLMKSGGGWAVLRPGFFAQNLESAYLRDVLEERRLYVPAGSGKIAFLDVRDVGACAAHVFVNPSAFAERSLALTGPEALTFARVAELMSEVLGLEIRYEAATVLGYVWHLKVRRKLPVMQVLVQTILHRGLRAGDAEIVESTVQELLGRPALSLRDYLERARAHFAR